MPFAANKRARTAACSKERGLSLGGFHLGNRQECDLDYLLTLLLETAATEFCLSSCGQANPPGRTEFPAARKDVSVAKVRQR